MAESLNICVVDDDRDFVDFIESLLVSEGYDVLVAFGQKDTYHLLQRTKPDLILLDVQLPDGNGVDISYNLKQEKEFADVPIYLVSAKMPGELRAIARDAQADGYLSKPLDIELLLETLDIIKQQLA